MTICQINHIRNTVELFTRNTIFDLVDHLFRTDEIGQFSDGNAHFAWGNASHRDPGTSLETSTASFICFTDSVEAHDDAAGRKVWTRHERHQVIQCRVRVT